MMMAPITRLLRGLIFFISFASASLEAAQPINSLNDAVNILNQAALVDPWYEQFMTGLNADGIPHESIARDLILHAYMQQVQSPFVMKRLREQQEIRRLRGEANASTDEALEGLELYAASPIFLEELERDLMNNAFGSNLTRCVHNGSFSGVNFPAIFNPDKRPGTCVCETLIVTGSSFLHGDVIMSSDLSVAGTAYIGGDLTVNGLFYLNSDTIAPNNILYVQKSPITAPNQFNSLFDAMNAVVGNSVLNPFLIVIDPGIYVEPTIMAKAFVTIRGSGALSTIIMAQSPNQDIFVTEPNVTIREVGMMGATGNGFAAVSHTQSGGLSLLDVIFYSNDILIRIHNPATNALIALSRMLVSSIAQFRCAIDLNTSGPSLAGVLVSSAVWTPVFNGLLEQFMSLSGPGVFVRSTSMELGSSVSPINGLCGRVEDGSLLQVIGSNIQGFDIAFSVTDVGASPTILLDAVSAAANNVDLLVLHPSAQGSVNASLKPEKVLLNPASTIALFLVDPVDGGVATQDGFAWGETFDQRAEISPLFNTGWGTGVINGGILSAPGGLQVAATGGLGYLMDGVEPTDHIKTITWAAQTITVPDDQDSFIYIDQNFTLQSALSAPGRETAILLGKARSNAGSILFMQEFPTDARHIGQRVNASFEDSFGSVYVSGSLTVTSTANPLQLNVGSGKYVYGSHQYNPSGGTPISFSTWLLSGSGGYEVGTSSTNIVDVDNWDDGTGMLALIPTGSYVRDVIYVAGDGPYETYLFQYGQTLYASQSAAAAGSLPGMPGNWSGNIAPIASLIITNSAIVQILDERPVPSFRAASSTGVTVHGDLSGLLADDHPQYLLVNGDRAMSGDLDMNGNDIITNGGLVDNVNVALHGSRHNPLDVDPISTLAPVTIGTSNQIGLQNALARSDHVHAHGNQPGGSLHAVATTSVAGFMSAADKTALDNLVTTTGNYIIQDGNSFGTTITIGTNDAQSLVLETSNTPRVAIAAAGAMSVAAPATGVGLTVNGNASSAAMNVTAGAAQAAIVATSGTGNSITTSAGTAALPAYAFTANPDLGIYSPVANSIAISTVGTQRLTINGAGGVSIAAPTVAAQSALIVAGASSAPAVSITQNGTQNAIAAGLGVAANPAYSFTSDSNTGVYSPGADQIALSTGGAARLTATTTAITSTLPITMSTGVATVYQAATGGNTVSISAPNSIGTSYALQLPSAQGAANQVLAQSGTPGILTWSTVPTQNFATALGYNSQTSQALAIGDNRLQVPDVYANVPGAMFGSVFTAPYTGIYCVNCCLVSRATNTNRVLTIRARINGTIFNDHVMSTGYAATNRDTPLSYSTLLILNAGDQVDMLANASNTGITVQVGKAAFIIYYLGSF